MLQETNAISVKLLTVKLEIRSKGFYSIAAEGILLTASSSEEHEEISNCVYI